MDGATRMGTLCHPGLNDTVYEALALLGPERGRGDDPRDADVTITVSVHGVLDDAEGALNGSSTGSLTMRGGSSTICTDHTAMAR
jgi:hypothetical protein